MNISELLNEYEAYSRSEEAYAVLFVKKYLQQSKGKWIDIIDYHVRHDLYSIDTLAGKDAKNLYFSYVKCGLYDKTIRPDYPAKLYDIKNHDYWQLCKAIVWGTANEDIKQQKHSGVIAPCYEIHGGFDTPDKLMFTDNAPDDIKALLDKTNDKADPLWDEAMQYIVDEIYSIKSIKLFTK